MRSFISSVALSSAILAQSAFFAVAAPTKSNKTTQVTALTCTPRTIGKDGIQANWQGSSEWPVTVTPYDFLGNAIPTPSIHFGLNSPSHILNSGGVGQISPNAQGEYTDNRRFEFARRNGRSEVCKVDFGQNAMDLGLKKATVTVSRFYLDGGRIRERGQWIACDDNGNPVAPKTVGSDFFYGVQNSGSGAGILTFTVETNLPFRSIKLIPLEGVSPTNNQVAVNSTVDNSDFMVRQIVIEFCEPPSQGTCEDASYKTATEWSDLTLNGVGYDGEPNAPQFVADPSLGGWGIVSSNPADIGPFKPELGWRMINGVPTSERLSVVVAGPTSEFKAADVKLARFYKEFGAIERGHYQLLDVNGLPISQADGGYGTFFAIEPNVAGNPGHFSFSIDATRPFTAIIFTADSWVNGGGTPQPTFNGDNSDYHVQELNLFCERRPSYCNECDARIGDEGLEDNWRPVVGLSATTFSGASVDVNFPTDASWRPNSGGWGVESPNAPEVANAQKFELGYRNGQTETATVDFGECNEFKVAEVTLARFYIENGLIERGKWTAYGPGMTFLATGEFQSTEAIEDNGPGYLTFSIETATKFQYIKFEALANKRVSNDQIVTTGDDNSDYLVRDIAIRCPQPRPCNEVLGRAGDESLWSEYADISAEQFGTESTPGAAISPYFLADGVNWKPFSGGIGVLSPGSPETAALAKFELGYRQEKSEKLIFDFRKGESFKKIIVKLARFYVEDGKREQGLWKAKDRDGNEVGRGNFLGTAPLSGPGYFDLTIETDRPMSIIEFSAGPNVWISTGVPSESTGDNSDYLVREFTIPCPPTNGGGIGFKAAEETTLTPSFNVYPNPAVDQINISMDSDKKDAVSYVVRDLAGKVIRTATWNVEVGANKTSVSVADLKNGMYLLTVTQGSEVKNTKFMIKR
jgi:hypothetical protein